MTRARHLILRATGCLTLIGLAVTVLTNSATMALTTPPRDHLSLTSQLQTQCGACHTGEYASAPDFRVPGILAARAHLAAARIRSGQMPPWPAAALDEQGRAALALDGQPDRAALDRLAAALSTASPVALKIAALRLRRPAAVSTLERTELPTLEQLPLAERAGGDPHLCRVFDVKPGWVSGLEVTPAPDSHHLIALRVPARTFAPAGTWRCDGTVGVARTEPVGSWVMGSERVNGPLPLHAGVHFLPGDRLLLQVHTEQGPGMNMGQAQMTVPGTPAENAAGSVRLIRSGTPLRPMWQIPVVAPVGAPCLNSPCQAGAAQPPEEVYAGRRLIRRCPPVRVTAKEAVSRCVSVARQPGRIVMLGLHAHAQASSLTLRVIRTSGEAQTLLSVPKWNVGWQGWYRPDQTALATEQTLIHTGDALEVTCHYPRGSRSVRFGFGAQDEMCVGAVQVVAP